MKAVARQKCENGGIGEGGKGRLRDLIAIVS